MATSFPETAPNIAEHTVGHLLNGRVIYAQPREGFRSGIEPVLLAAAIPAKPGQRVVEGGCGAGAALLCLAARVPGAIGIGVEQDRQLVALARQNAVANGWPALSFIAADIGSLPPLGAYDHACANPPYHPERGTPSPHPARQAAKRGAGSLLYDWAKALAHGLHPRGTLTFVLAAGMLPDALGAFAHAGCRPSSVLPLWPREGQPAKLVLLRGVKGARSPFRVLPGLVLHTQTGEFTPTADAILRDGRPLEL
jgi:tRNA1Val (adenine37-N6)-methyltransferase